MYESEFIKLPISSFCNQGGIHSDILIGLPVLMDVPGVGWMAITEADLENNASMYVVNPSQDWTGHWFESRIAPHIDDPSICVVGSLPHTTAWRVLLVGDEPGRLIESNVITSLNPPNRLADTSWIHPGKSTWNWWSGSGQANRVPDYSTATMEYYVDFSAKSGFRYMLIDAGWFKHRDITQMNGKVDVPAVVKYAAAKGVKIWIWLDAEDVARQMDRAFPIYEQWGVAGCKIDFVERDDQGGIAWYYRVAALAAQHHLMMDFHGATKPTGMNRTYPNVMGYEAVLGMEQSKAGMRDNPDHEVTLPFTRMLAGPMDFTPGAFDNVTRDQFEPVMDKPMVMGTRAHQLAMYVVYDAPFEMVSDNPVNYEGQPAFKFIKDVPTTWDETRVLAGRPGEFITTVRRSGRDWYLGSMTGWMPRRIVVPLKFLPPGSYTAEIFADASDADQNPKDVTIETKAVDNTQDLQFDLAPGGGAAAEFHPAQ
ncbi:MAG TPA: glycoside hydrolase family 97 catalytic domain-containing protein, partial [Tepidisphaeraceae bacterium]|nr:glycoside hydrolase family 97 catalytic domain-containing protein [Tepidisphaeraceae bacterium]